MSASGSDTGSGGSGAQEAAVRLDCYAIPDAWDVEDAEAILDSGERFATLSVESVPES
jgi:hypothetical protein